MMMEDFQEKKQLEKIEKIQCRWRHKQIKLFSYSLLRVYICRHCRHICHLFMYFFILVMNLFHESCQKRHEFSGMQVKNPMKKSLDDLLTTLMRKHTHRHTENPFFDEDNNNLLLFSSFVFPLNDEGIERRLLHGESFQFRERGFEGHSEAHDALLSPSSFPLNKRLHSLMRCVVWVQKYNQGVV